jgi:acetyltransferase-like isoleucine patch superfamily enzyme
MGPSEAYTPVVAPREGVNDDVVRVIEWLAEDGQWVEKNQPLATLETTKATFPLESPRAGYLFRQVAVGAEVPVGEPIAAVADRPERPKPVTSEPAAPPAASEQVISAKARAAMGQHGLTAADFPGLAAIRVADVEALAQKRAGAAAGPPGHRFGGGVLDPAADWDRLTDTDLRRQIAGLLTLLRKRTKARFNRHLPTGELLHDRWDLARECGFGEGTSVYDSCLVMGDVTVGRDCWVGPYTILDGLNAALKIGDSVDIGAGAHLYTHNTIERALTGRKAALFARPTVVGNRCFIAPNAILAPGTVLGDHCFVAAGSYVEGTFPAFSFIAGNPAKRVGVVEVTGDRARVRPLPDKAARPES